MIIQVCQQQQSLRREKMILLGVRDRLSQQGCHGTSPGFRTSGNRACEITASTSPHASAFGGMFSKPEAVFSKETLGHYTYCCRN